MKMGDVMKESVFSLAEAKFTTGDFNHMVLQNVSKAQLKVRSKKDNVAGEFTGDKSISILYLSSMTSDLQFSLDLQTHELVL